MRVHVCAVRMTLHRADVLEAYLNGQDIIQKATVYERTGDVVLTYRGSRKDAAALLAAYRFDNEELEVLVTSHDSRKINQEYQEKMVSLVAGRMFRKVFLPAPIAAAYTVWRSIAFVWKGIRCLLHRKLEVEVLDALSITASLLRGDYSTAGSVMFLLTVGSLLEEWTRKKSLDDLARSMALNVDKVWVRTPQGEVLVPADPRPRRGRSGGALRQHDPAGRHGAGGRGHGEPSRPDRRVHAGAQDHRCHRLRRNSGGRGRMRPCSQGRGRRQPLR